MTTIVIDRKEAVLALLMDYHAHGEFKNSGKKVKIVFDEQYSMNQIKQRMGIDE